MKSLKQFLNEKTDEMYKVKDAMGKNARIRYKKTSSGWEVSQDEGDTWKKARPDHPSALMNTDEIEAEVDIGSIVKV